MNPHDTLPTKVKSYIRNEKIQVSYLNLDNVWWFIFFKNIFVNQNKNLYKKRFIICHELWHYYFWDKISIPYLWYSYQEKRADDFALKKLLPKERLLEEFSHFDWDLTILEKIFGVEMPLIEKRLKQILLLKN